jgi:hypothetical protein
MAINEIQESRKIKAESCIAALAAIFEGLTEDEIRNYIFEARKRLRPDLKEKIEQLFDEGFDTFSSYSYHTYEIIKKAEEQRDEVVNKMLGRCVACKKEVPDVPFKFHSDGTIDVAYWEDLMNW